MDNMLEYQLEGQPFYKKDQHWVALNNYSKEIQAGLPSEIAIHDVTLRDGEQTSGIAFLEDERVRIAEILSDLGVSRIEAGMPTVSPIIENALRRMTKANLKTKVFGFGRAHPKDIQLCLDCGVQGIIIEHTVNPYICKYGYDLTPQLLVERLVNSINLAKEAGIYVVFMGWDWFRAPIEFTKWLVGELVKNTKLDGLTVVDTLGCTVPDVVEDMIRKFTNWFPSLTLEFHGHNDFGLGNACTLAAVKGGARVIHTAMNGLGERIGNVATEEMGMILKVLQGIDTGLDLKKINRASRIISSISNIELYPNKPITGKRAFQIEVGLAVHYTLRMSKEGIYPSGLPFAPTLIGKSADDFYGGAEYLLGKTSGRASIQMFLEKNGLTASIEEMDAIVEEVKKESYLTKNIVPEEEFLEIVRRVKAVQGENA